MMDIFNFDFAVKCIESRCHNTWELIYRQPICRSIWNDVVLTKGGNACKVIMLDVVEANQKTESLYLAD